MFFFLLFLSAIAKCFEGPVYYLSVCVHTCFVGCAIADAQWAHDSTAPWISYASVVRGLITGLIVFYKRPLLQYYPAIVSVRRSFFIEQTISPLPA